MVHSFSIKESIAHLYIFHRNNQSGKITRIIKTLTANLTVIDFVSSIKILQRIQLFIS